MKKLVLFGSFLACAFAFAGIEYSADGKSATVTGLTTLTSAGQLPDVETLTLSAGSVLSLDGIDAFTLKANIEGSGLLTSSGSTFTLTGDNRGHDGEMRFTNSFVYVTSRYGLGDADNGRYVWTWNNPDTAGVLRFRGEGLTNDAPLAIRGNRKTADTYFVDNYTDLLVLNGDLRAKSFMEIAFGNVLFNGSLIHDNTWYCTEKASSTCTFHAPIKDGTCTYWLWSLGTGAKAVFESTENQIKGARLMGTGFMCAGENVLWTNDTIDLGERNDPATLNLNGFDQKVMAVTQGRWNPLYNAAAGTWYKPAATVTSVKPAVFKMIGNGTKSYGANLLIAGAVDLIWSGEGTYVMSNKVSTTTGKLTVAAGAMDFVGGASWQGTNVNVEGSATLKMGPGSTFNSNGTTQLFVDDEATLELDAAAVIRVTSAKVRGVDLAVGKYYNDTPGLAGAGCLEVSPIGEAIVHEWTGLGGDRLVTNPNNWADPANPPTFRTGWDVLSFKDSSVDSAEFPTGVSAVLGLRFETSRPFTLASAAGGVVKLGRNGIFADTTAETIITNVVSVPLNLSFPQIGAWTVNTNVVLRFTSSLQGGFASDSFAMSGWGGVQFEGDNAALGAELHVSNLNVRVTSPTGLGGPDRYTIFHYYDRQALSGEAHYAYLKFANDATNCCTPVGFDCQGQFNKVHSFVDDPDKDVLRFKKPFSAYNRVSNPYMTEIYFDGGVTNHNGNFWMEGSSVYNVYVLENPILCHGDYLVTGSSIWHIGTTGNAFACFAITSPVVCECEDALTCNLPRAFVSLGVAYTSINNGYLDLNGYTQHVCRFYHRGFPSASTPAVKGDTKFGTVKSAKPAAMVLMPAVAETFTNQVKFTSCASLTMNGEGKTTFINARSDSTGTVSVESGTLVFAWGAGWDNVGEVNVTGGKLSIESDSMTCAFGPEEGRSAANLAVSGTGKLDLAAGTATVRSLQVNGRDLPPGLYGASDNTSVPAANRIPQITGAGTLRTRKLRNGGLILLVH